MNDHLGLTALYLLFALGLAYVLAALIAQIANSWLTGQKTIQVVTDAIRAQRPDVEPIHFIDWNDGRGALRICCFQQMTRSRKDALAKKDVAHIFMDDCNRDYTFQKGLVTCPACLFRICVEIER